MNKTVSALFFWIQLFWMIKLIDCKNRTKNELLLEQEITKHLKHIHYERTVRPPIKDSFIVNEQGHYPVIVKVNIFVVAFSSISVSDNDFTLDILVRQMWIDKRLVLNHTFEFLSIGYLKPILWTPDLFFRNSKKSSMHTVTEPNYMIWLFPDGTLKFSQKVTVTLFCEMNLWNFPLDTQICKMQIGSYGYPIEDLRFEWWSLNGKVIFVNEPLNLNEFYSPEISTSFCYSYSEFTGNFSCLEASFVLRRKFGFYLFYTYMPSIFIVSISWVAFFIDHTAVPARITLGLLALLALMTQTSAVVEKLPRVSYVKAIDVWMFTCLAFVIISLFEFAVVNCQARKQDKNKLHNEMCNAIKNELFVLGSIVQQASKADNRNLESNRLTSMLSEENDNTSVKGIRRLGKLNNIRKLKFKPRQIDKAFSIWFPLAFLLFNIVYWFFYNRSLH